MEKVYAEIIDVAKKYHVAKVILFGSRARGDYRRNSDIDIAVFFLKGYLEKERAAFMLDISEELPTLYEINVVFVNNETDERLLKNIHDDGVTLFMRESKLDNYVKAVKRVNEAKGIYLGSQDDLHRDGLIQRFEFTFELAWKTLKEYLESEGYIEAKTPKSVLKTAFSLDLINGEEWNDMLADRIQAAQIYDESVAASICGRITATYAELFDKLADKLSDVINK